MIDRGALLDWLASQAAARPRAQRLDIFLYARRPEELWPRMSAMLSAASIGHALTGAAAAALHNAGPTAVPLTLVRIAADVLLARAARALDAEVAERGANIRLVADTGGVGTIGAEMIKGTSVAPPVRIYLDALGERRGDDIASHFREAVLGY
ncbi:MAG: hypothetical protein EXR77_16965 [Myxococcales bacterium]|nr:hypothetical protein [Myxococcales bacterium]